MAGFWSLRGRRRDCRCLAGPCPSATPRAGHWLATLELFLWRFGVGEGGQCEELLRSPPHMAPPTSDRLGPAPWCPSGGDKEALWPQLPGEPGPHLYRGCSLVDAPHGTQNSLLWVLMASGFSRAVNECQSCPTSLHELRWMQLLVINVCISHSEPVLVSDEFCWSSQPCEEENGSKDIPYHCGYKDAGSHFCVLSCHREPC